MARMLFLRDLDVDIHLRCLACGHGGVLPRGMLVRRFGQNYPVLSIAPHYRCSRCDSRDTESRPGPTEHHPVIDQTGASADPSFDASLAALQGLLASVRDPGKGAADDGSDEDDAPAFRPFAVPEPDRWDDDPEDEAETIPEAVQGASRQDAFPAAESKHAFRPLEDLVADGPADEDAEPLWEPVSLADLAARSGDDGLSPFDEVTEAGEPDDAPFDETLDAMRRFFAETELADEDAARPRPVLAEDAEGEGEAEDEDDAEPTVFSHKALVRRDFEADVDEETSDADAFADAFDEDDDDELSGKGDDEPTEEEILAFAIRDPEKVSAPPPRVERAIKPPPPPPAEEEEEGFDRTLAALRSMIEEAASEPKVVPVRRKTRPPAEPLFDATEDGDRPAELPPKEPPAVKKVPAAKAAKAPAKTAGSKRSAQEREIEEAMKALGGMDDDDDAAPPEPAPSFRPVAVKPAQPPVRSGKPKLDLVRDDTDAEPPAEKTGAGESDASPLSKTIAALRGMLELDGRRKR